MGLAWTLLIAVIALVIMPIIIIFQDIKINKQQNQIEKLEKNMWDSRNYLQESIDKIEILSRMKQSFTKMRRN